MRQTPLTTGVAIAAALVVCSLPALPAWSLDPSRAISQYALRHWAAEDGLPHNSVMALAQTTDRYLWVGTQEGLARFDGVRFTYFGRETHPEFRSHFVFALCADRAGGLWVGTRGGGVVEIRDGVLRNYGKPEGLPDDTIIALAEAPDGAIWVGTLSDGLARIHRGKITTFTARDGLPGGAVRDLAFGPEGELWIALADAGLVRLHRGRVRHFTEADGLPSRKVRTLHSLRSGELWLATMDAGMFRFKDGVFESYRGRDGFNPPLIRSMNHDRNGNLWIGTDAQGLARLTNGRITSLRDHPLFPHTADVWSIIEDDEGTLWVGLDKGGLTQIRNGKVLTYTSKEGLPTEALTAIATDQRGNVWVATYEGLSRFDGSSFENVDLGNVSSNTIFSLHPEADGTLWAGMRSGEVVRMTADRRSTTYAKAEGLPGVSVLAVYRDPRGPLWAGTTDGLGRMDDSGRFTMLTEEHGLGSRVVRFIHRDRKGMLWVATDGAGLNRYVNGRFKPWGTAEGFPSDFVRAIHEDADGVLWVGTGGAGLVRIENDRMTHYTVRDGLPHDTVYAVVEDARGNLWCTTGRGIFVVSRRELNEFAAGTRRRIEPTSYGREAGLSSAEGVGGVQRTGARATDGRIWFSMGGGAVVVDPARIASDRFAPTVYIEQVTVDQQVVKPEDGMRLPAGSRTFEFRYAGINYTAPDRVSYRYKLEGFDDDWIDSVGKRRATYTNLNPGTYRFHVIAANADGVWNRTGDALAFDLQPFFYQTIWFRLLLLALVVAAVLQIIRVRVRLLNAEAAARTAMMEESLTRGQKLQSLGQLASGVAHEFNNTMMMALPWAETLRKARSGDALVEKAATNIRDACLRAKDITLQLLDFAQPKPLKKEEVDLHELVQTQIRLLRPSFGPGYEMVVREDPDVGRVEADASQLQQVIVNLALNARDAMPNGGVVTFEIRHMTDGERRLWGIASETCVVLTVSDTGKGMDEETKNRIFDPFFTTKDIGHGTGLGLSIVHRIVEQHGGRIIVDTGEHGTSIHITLTPVAGDDDVSRSSA